MSQQTITIRDVAAKANVSIGTVSRVLNGAAGVDPERLARVTKAIDDLGYRKSGLAQALASRRSGAAVRTGNIGIVFTDMTHAWLGHPLLSRYISGVEKACREQGYHPIIELSEQQTDAVPSCVAEKKIDGLLVKATNNKPQFIDNLPDDLPVVGLSMSEPSFQFPQVAPDNIKGGMAVAEYLWDAGHRRIAFLCTEGRHRMFIGRYQGYEEFMRSRGAFDAELVRMDSAMEYVNTPSSSFPNVMADLRKLWDRPAEKRPTAIIAANDWMAAGIYNAALDMGIRIPDELSVVGTDNTSDLCNVLRPALTSYEVPLIETAYAAAQTLLEMIKNPDKPRLGGTHLIAGKLVERASVRVIM